MRLILSTLFAAALVFGGTLLFAHYFGSVEVRDEGLQKQVHRETPDSETRTTTRGQCPEIARLLTGTMPAMFVELPSGPDPVDAEFNFVSVALSEILDETPGRATGAHLVCTYIKVVEATGIQNVELTGSVLELALTPSLDAEISIGEIWSDYMVTHSDERGYSCDASPQQCEFKVLRSQ